MTGVDAPPLTSDLATALANLGGADVRAIEAEGLTWVALERIGELKQSRLREQFSFHPLELHDIASRNQRPKVDDYGA